MGRQLISYIWIKIVSDFDALEVLIGEKLFRKKVWCGNWTTSNLSLSCKTNRKRAWSRQSDNMAASVRQWLCGFWEPIISKISKNVFPILL